MARTIEEEVKYPLTTTNNSKRSGLFFKRNTPPKKKQQKTDVFFMLDCYLRQLPLFLFIID